MLQDLMLMSYVKKQWLPHLLQEEDEEKKDIYRKFLKKFLSHSRAQYRALIGSDGILQAAACVYRRPNFLWIELLISAPYRIKGAGTRLLVRCAKEALLFCDGQIKLSSVPSAVSFYQERGFRAQRPPPPHHPEWDTQMYLPRNGLINFIKVWSSNV